MPLQKILLAPLLFVSLSVRSFAQKKDMLTATAPDRFIAIADSNTQLKIGGSLSLDEFLSFLRAETETLNDNKVLLAFVKDTAMFASISEGILDMSPDDLRSSYREQEIQGKFTMPTFYTSQTELAAYVATTPGAIGIISKKLFKDLTGVKQLKVGSNEYIDKWSP